VTESREIRLRLAVAGFGARCYVSVKPISIPLSNGEALPVIHMEKSA